MQQGDLDLGLECGQGLLEPAGHVAGVAHEALHLGLAEIAAAGPGEPAAETLGARHSDGLPVDVDHRGFALQDGHAGILEDAADLVGLVAVVVVVSEHGDDRHRQI